MLYKLEETRLRQTRSIVSAANAEVADIGGGVPQNKLWVIHAFGYWPSVTETQVICFAKYLPAESAYVSLFNPTSFAINPSNQQSATFIEQGMEVVLWPGEYIRISRGGHTAGSTMIAFMQFTELDLPLYTYDEPQVIKRQDRALSGLRSTLAGGFSRGRGGGITTGSTSPRPPSGGGGRLRP